MRRRFKGTPFETESISYVSGTPSPGRNGSTPRWATADGERALAWLERLVGTGVGTLLPGRGSPWTDGAERALREAWRVDVL